MKPAERARLERQLELRSTARRQAIRESLRESAVSTKCALLEPSIRTYGSPRTRRKFDVEEDHAIAVLSMSPYPVSKLDLLDDLADISNYVPINNSLTSSSAGSSSSSSWRDGEEKEQAMWGTSIRAYREGGVREQDILTDEEIHRREQKKLNEALNNTPQAPEQRRIQYSNYTQSLIERTHSKLYDMPKYISMAKRAMGIEDDEETDRVLADVSRIEKERSRLNETNRVSCTAVCHSSLFSSNLTVEDLTNGEEVENMEKVWCGSRYLSGGDYFDTDNELPLLEDDSYDDDDDYDESKNHSRITRSNQKNKLHKWNKGAPSVYTTGATVSTDGVYGRKDEPRVQGESRLELLGSANVSASASKNSNWKGKFCLQAAPSTPGIVHKHIKPNLQMGAPSLDGHEMNSYLQNEGKESKWEIISRAHALTFRDSITSPRATAC
jgi:hypothetical protein